MSGRTQTGPSPSDVVEDGPRTDVTDIDELREEFLAGIEDAEAGDFQTLEGRLQHLLSDTRRHRQHGDSR